MTPLSLATQSTFLRLWQQPAVRFTFGMILAAAYVLWSPEAWAITGGELTEQVTKVDQTIKNMLRPALYAVFAITAGMSIYKQNPTGICVGAIGLVINKFLGDWIVSNYTLTI